MTPAGGPTATYRLQIQPGFGFADAAALSGYLADLGVGHVYLSPILEPTAGSTHGYDVVSHTRLNTEAGGRPAFDEMVAAFHAAGLKVVVDVVPNHMAVPTPEHANAPLWQVLKDGRESPYARWFDIDWAAGDDTVLMPVLGDTLENVLAAGDLVIARDGGAAGDEMVVRYFEHELPVRAGTEELPLEQLVHRQWWRLADWHLATTDLNYRRFFDVTSLIAVRVEDPEVFDRTHALLVELVRDGSIDGLRIDHPDGLADPAGYLRRLAEVTDDTWVVVEKILEGDEQLPTDWACAGTTGYDALWRVGSLFVDPSGQEPLTDLLALHTGIRRTLDETVVTAKREIADRVLVAEVSRLQRGMLEVLAALPGPTPTPESVRRVLTALLVGIERYRAYVVPGEPADTEAKTVLDAARARAAEWLADEDLRVLDTVREVLLGRVGEPLPAPAAAALDDVVVRFQQTCGPVMAKGIEDTAFYRWHRLVALNEVGGDPDHFATSPAELEAFATRIADDWPRTMTTLSTHDTKRAEDVRARLAVLSHRPLDWADWLVRAKDLVRPHRSAEVDGATEYLLWQTVVGAWPISTERLTAYAQKAIRESKKRTTWTEPDEAYEKAIADLATAMTTDDAIASHVEAWVASSAQQARAIALGQKLIQLVMPGAPDVYQGAELVDLSLVDPDNRRLVDYADRRARLARLDGGDAPADLDDEKLLVTARTLQLRRDHPLWFVGNRSMCAAVRSTSDAVFALARGDVEGMRVVAVVTRRPVEPLPGSAGDAPVPVDLEVTIELPAGDWVDAFTGRAVTSAGGEGGVEVADVLGTLPVALLVRADA